VTTFSAAASSAISPPTWVCFTRPLEPSTLDPSAHIDRYRIERVSTVSGAPLSELEAGAELTRIESTRGLPTGASGLVGVTQHLGYQTAAERGALAPPPPPSVSIGGHCVLIPISKSEEWWSLAHDERNRAFRDEEPRGHIRVGRPHASRIFRKLYHSRYVPGASWDFLTYFEFPSERAQDFTELLRGLRDTQRNPEWRFVVHEIEIWMRRIPV
jgi:hypothetical protein